MTRRGDHICPQGRCVAVDRAPSALQRTGSVICAVKEGEGLRTSVMLTARRLYALEAALGHENQIVDCLSDRDDGPHLEDTWHWLTSGNAIERVLRQC